MGNKILSGKGFYLWKIRGCEKGDPVKIAAAAKEAGHSHALIKIADGVVAYNRGLVEPLVIELEKLEIEAWGWQYIYGQQPENEAGLAAGLVDGLGLAGFVVNAEVEFEKPGAQEKAERYMGRLNAKIPAVDVALSSFRFPSAHGGFPFETFMRAVDFAMPQVYWMQAHNPRMQLRQCLAEYKAYGKPVLPTGAAFREHGWQATGAEVTEFLNACREFGVPGANFWEWANSKVYAADCWEAVARFEWGGDPLPKPEPDPAGGLKLRVLTDQLRVRSGPGLNYPVVDSLAAGQELSVYGVDGTEVWVEHGAGRWSALRRGSTRYMEIE